MAQQVEQEQVQEKVVERVVYVERPKRKLGRKILLGGVVVIVGLGFIGAMGNDGNDSGNGNNGGGDNAQVAKASDPNPNSDTKPYEPKPVADKEAPKPEAAKAPVAKPKPKPQAAIGQPVEVQGAVWRVDRAYETTALKDIYGLEPPKRGNFVVVDFTFTNTGKEAVTLDSTHMTLTDSGNATYETDTDTFSYIPARKDIFLNQVNPGVTQQGRVIFSVAPSAADFTFHGADMDFWSDGEAKVDLGF